MSQLPLDINAALLHCVNAQTNHDRIDFIGVVVLLQTDSQLSVKDT
jgi:hypothetical protein